MAKSPNSMNGIADRINNFNFNFNEVVKRDTTGNVIFSPFSIYTALAMLGTGAAAKTKREIATALSWEDDDLLPLLKMLQSLYNELSKGSNGTTLDIANKAWVGKNMAVLPTYRGNITKYFGVEMGQEDFVNNPDSARQNINEWVEKKTDRNIKELFPPGSIVKATRLVLANAVYFKGAWENTFDKEDTYEDYFYITRNEKVSVEFMFKHDKVSTAVDNKHKVQLLQLPYAGGVCSIIFAIPFAKCDTNGEIESFDDLSTVEDNIKDKTNVLNNWIAMLPDITKVLSEIDITVPKFEIKLDVDLITQLQTLGINDLFDPGNADLSGISDETDLYVSSAAHKAFIKVDEEGTTAAAATGFAANCFSMTQPQEVFLNHPFLFYIIHRGSNAIIFSGKVQNPQI